MEKIWTTEKYNKIAGKYDRKMQYFLPDKYRDVAAEMLIPGSVLDIACGTGTFLKKAEKRGLECFGLDLSPGMIDQAKKKLPEVNLTVGSYYELPFSDNSFDNVTSTYALGGVHIDIHKAVSEMIRVCKPGGRIIILDGQKKTKENLFDRIFVKIASLSEDQPRDFIKALEDFGLMAETIKLSYMISIILSRKPA